MTQKKSRLKRLLIEQLVCLTSIRNIENLQLETLKILSVLLDNIHASLYLMDGKDICYRVLSYPENSNQPSKKTSRYDTLEHETLGIEVPDYIVSAANWIDEQHTFYHLKSGSNYYYVHPHIVDTRNSAIYLFNLNENSIQKSYQ